MISERFPFRLRAAAGSVIVSFDANEDPQRWGYDALGLAWPTELAQGLPVSQRGRSVRSMGTRRSWVGFRSSASRCSNRVGRSRLASKAPAGHHEWVDGPPQLRGLGVPFTLFGVCPTLFDAPASTESDTTFMADSWLTRAQTR